MGRYRHVGHTAGVRGLGRPSAALSQVDGRSWERHFQRRDAKCFTLGISEAASTPLLAFQRHSWHFRASGTSLFALGCVRFARDLLMRVHPRGTSAASGLEITAELIVIDRITIGRCGTVPALSLFSVPVRIPPTIHFRHTRLLFCRCALEFSKRMLAPLPKMAVTFRFVSKPLACRFAFQT